MSAANMVKPYDAKSIASILSGQLRVTIKENRWGMWKYDFPTKTIFYNPQDLSYLKKEDVVAHLLHESGHAKYSIPVEELKLVVTMPSDHQIYLRDLIQVINNFRIEDKIREFYPYGIDYLPLYGFKTCHALREDAKKRIPAAYTQYVYKAYEEMGGYPIEFSNPEDPRIRGKLDQTIEFLLKARVAPTEQALADIVYTDVYPLIKDLLDEHVVKKQQVIAFIIQVSERKEQESYSYDELYSQIKPLIAPTTATFQKILTDTAFDKHEGKFRTGTKLFDRKLFKFAMGDTRLFQRKIDKKNKDYIFSLVVDESGSMAREDKILHAVKTAILFAAVLEKIGLPYTLHGFNLTYRTYKTAEEPFSNKTKKHFEGMFPQVETTAAGWNNDGDAIVKFAKPMLKYSGKKVMFVLSDGHPETKNAAWPNLETAVTYVANKGIMPVGIGIVDSTVKKYYPIHTVVSQAEDLPKAMLKMLRNSMKK